MESKGREAGKRKDAQVRGEDSVMEARAKGVAHARGRRTEAHGAGAAVGHRRRAASAEG